MERASVFKPCAFLVALFYCLHVSGQTVILEGLVLSMDDQPVSGATIEYSEGRGVTTNARGLFTIELPKRGAYRLTIRSLGFTELDTTIQLNESRNYLLVHLKEKVYTQPEVVVSEKATTVFDYSDWLLLDLKVFKDRIYAIHRQNNNNYLVVSNLMGIILDKIELKGQYDAFYESCSERLYLKSRSEIAEVALINGEIEISGKPVSKDNFEKYLQPCVCKLEKEYIFKSFTDHNKRLHYFKYNDKKEQNLIHEIFDIEAYRVARSYYEEILRLYYSYASNSEGNGIDEGMQRYNIIESGDWNGDLAQLILNNELHFAVSYYQNIESRAIDSYEFKQQGSFYVIDKLNRQILKYNELARKPEKLDVDSSIPWPDLDKVLVDKKASKVYLTDGQNVLYALKVQDSKVEVEKAIQLSESWARKEGLQIYGGVLYYYYRPDATRLSTRLKKIDL